MNRVVVVYNPRSSQAGVVKGEVLGKILEAVRYEVEKTNVDDNARKLAKVVKDGDLVISAGGDATATIGMNGVMLSGVDATFAALPYGNFSDVARELGVKSVEGALEGGTREVWMLECLIDGKHWRYGLGYFTAGLLAEAAEMFDKRAVRGKLRKGKRGLIGQLVRAVEWYGKNRRKQFLPREVTYNGSVVKNTTDVIAMNGGEMARVMRGRDMRFNKVKFMAGVAKSGGWISMIWFGMRSVLWRVPVEETDMAVVEFEEPTDVEVQGEGEYKKWVGIKKIEIRKSERRLRVVQNLQD